MSNDTKDFCYAPGDEGSEFCGDPRNLHCSVLGDSAFWESAEGQEHLIKCMRDDHLIHHAFIAERSAAEAARCRLNCPFDLPEGHLIPDHPQPPFSSVVEAPPEIRAASVPSDDMRRLAELLNCDPSYVRQQVELLIRQRDDAAQYFAARVHQPDVQEDWKNRFDAHTKAVGEFLSEMAEIYSLDVLLGDEMNVQSVTAELLKVGRDIREKLAQPDVQAADGVITIIRDMALGWKSESERSDVLPTYKSNMAQWAYAANLIADNLNLVQADEVEPQDYCERIGDCSICRYGNACTCSHHATEQQL